jgi:GNAT superfamily N-acetyltransferase
VVRLDDLQFCHARPCDAARIAALHAESWRLHYRGAYSDAFLDGDVAADRLAVWTERLRESDDGTHTILVDDDGTLVGFAHTVFDDDPTWGVLLDNLHVASSHQRLGIGARLLALSARAVIDKNPGSPLYLWVLEKNVAAQAFYCALGGTCVERVQAAAPGGVDGRLNGTPAKLRIAWADTSFLASRCVPPTQKMSDGSLFGGQNDVHGLAD